MGPHSVGRLWVATALAALPALGAEALLEVTASLRIESTKEQTLRFIVSPALCAQRPALRLLARLDRPELDGSTFSMVITLNGRALSGERLLNKPPETRMFSGLPLTWFGQNSFRVVYSPDYEAANREDSPNCLEGGQAYEFVLDTGAVLKEGENVLTVRHSEPLIQNALVLASVGLIPAPPRTAFGVVENAPPPTGELPRLAPGGDLSGPRRVEILPGGGFAVETGSPVAARVSVRSSFSYPKAGWNVLGEARGPGQEDAWQPQLSVVPGVYTITAAGSAYRLERKISIVASEHIEVADRLTNLTDQPVLVAQRHSIVLADLEKPVVTLRGLQARLFRTEDHGGDNPTVLLKSGDWGFGLVAEDDVLRAQCSQFVDPALGEAGLRTVMFMLAPRTEYTVRWSVYPVRGGDYFDFVNAVRRNWGTNFTIPGPFSFPPHPTLLAGQVPDLKAWLDNGAFACVSLQIPMPRTAELAHGLAFLDAKEEQQRLKAQADQLRALRPGLKVLQYLHVYITRSDRAVETYATDRHLGPDGTQYTYGAGNWKPTFWLFTPTPENAYGRAMNRTFDLCLDDLGFDGIYWDELSNSSQEIIYNQKDGHTALPDMDTLTVKQAVASTALYCQSYQVQQANRVLHAGKMLIGNGQPVTATLTELKFPRFVEAWHPANLRYAHLYCPLGLGSPDRVRSEDDIARNVRDNLEHGGLWYYYCNWGQVHLTRPTITARLFPFTPLELHAGTLIGQERIVTTRSGLFGWRDASPRRVYVYDATGQEKPEFQAPVREIEGCTYTELRLPGGWLAVIERER